jgi:hypothetical protein
MRVLLFVLLTLAISGFASAQSTKPAAGTQFFVQYRQSGFAFAKLVASAQLQTSIQYKTASGKVYQGQAQNLSMARVRDHFFAKAMLTAAPKAPTDTVMGVSAQYTLYFTDRTMMRTAASKVPTEPAKSDPEGELRSWIDAAKTRALVR